MRNSETDLIGQQLQSAFTKSGLSVQEFITHIAVTRADKIIDQRNNAFDILVGCSVLTCYFNEEWWCKA
jgi:hypothetical protein